MERDDPSKMQKGRLVDELKAAKWPYSNRNRDVLVSDVVRLRSQATGVEGAAASKPASEAKQSDGAFSR
jgi:hypothetical protein